jgi:hypothetical protein
MSYIKCAYVAMHFQVYMVFVLPFVQILLLSTKLGNLIVECVKCYGFHVLLTKLKKKTKIVQERKLGTIWSLIVL